MTSRSFPGALSATTGPATTRPATGRRQPATPAQRVILVLGVPLVLAVIAWTGYGIVAVTGHGSYTVTSAAPLSGGQLTLNDDGGDGKGDSVTIQGGAATGSVRVTGTVSYDLTRPDIRPSLNATRGPAGTNVAFACPQVNCDLAAAASVPSRTSVSFTVSGGGWNTTSVSGIAAPITATTNGGDLTLNADTGTLALSTGGGSVEGTALAAPEATVNTGDGFGDGSGGNVDLMLTTVPKSLQVNSGGGNVTIELPPGAARYHLELDGGCGNGSGAQSAVPSSGGSASSSWCADVSNSVPDDPSSPNVIVVSSGGGQITIT
jgi:hypothetical protein